MIKKLYKFTAADEIIFNRAAETNDPTWIFNYYIRSEDSGTWWRWVDPKLLDKLQMEESRQVGLRWQEGYNKLFNIWDYYGKPDYFGPVADGADWQRVSHEEYLKRSDALERVYRVVWQDAEHPVFHHPHGLQLLPWQLKLHQTPHPITINVGGFGCIAGETVLDGTGKTVEQCYREKVAPIVWAWTGERFVQKQASIPWIKGRTDLYRVTTQSGRSIVVTQEHRFLTDCGWRHLSECSIGSHLAAFSLPLQKTSSESFRSELHEGDQHYWKTTQDFQFDCRPVSHCDGEQLLGDRDTCQDVPPLQGDVYAHTHLQHVDDRALSGKDSLDPNEHHLAMSGLDHRIERLVKQSVDYDYVDNDEVIPCFASLPAVEDNQESGACCNHSAPTSRFDHGTEHIDSDVLLALQTPLYDSITNIEFEREDVFYDLHVPVYENYLAHGLINHNSAKTWGKALSMIVRAVTLVGYRGFILAPYSNQAEEVHKQVMQMIEGTLFEQFLISHPTRPRPTLNFGHTGIGHTSIECYSVLDDAGKILNLSGDEMMIDQAEQLPDLEGLIRNAGSRLRGQIKGRPRIGQISLLANSADNPELWDMVDEADDDPDYIWCYHPTSWENTYLTLMDLFRYEKQVGKDDYTRKMYMMGKRPIGSGEHFPKASLDACHATWLDEWMTDNLNRNTKGWVRDTRKGTGIWKWERPPEPDAEYIVAADPGWGNPPKRNAAAIMVWDITDFPKRPAIMAAFCWVFGYGSPNPWIAQYIEYTYTYKAIANNGFDSTGLQSGYERLTEINDLLPTTVSLSGSRKYIFLNLAKKLMADGMFAIPSISHIFSQCAKYHLPDIKLRQDLVMAILVSAALLEQYYYSEEDVDEEELAKLWETMPSQNERYWREPQTRYNERTQR